MIIYDTNTTNFEGKNTFELRVPCEWAHYKLHKNAWLVGIGPSKPKLWLIELEQITNKLFAWMSIYDTITINFEGKNNFDLSVPCEWAHHKHLHCTFQTKVMADGTWTNHNEANCMDVNLGYEFWGEKHFWFKCSMWMSSIQECLKC